MKTALILSAILLTSVASAESLTAKDIRERLEVRADIYTLDETGTKIVEGPKRTNYWVPNKETGLIRGQWSSQFGEKKGEEQLLMGFEFKTNDDGTMVAKLTEYSKLEADDGTKKTELSNPIQEKEISIKNFEPITMVAKGIKNKTVVVRYIPSLREIKHPMSVDNLPVAGRGIRISDNKGYLWAEDVDLNGKYIGVTTHRGTLAVSYVPFKGAREMGSVEGNVMSLNVSKDFQIKLTSESSFLPSGVSAKVYAVYNPNKVTHSFNSLGSFDSSKEARIQDRLK